MTYTYGIAAPPGCIQNNIIHVRNNSILNSYYHHKTVVLNEYKHTYHCCTDGVDGDEIRNIHNKIYRTAKTYDNGIFNEYTCETI